MVGFWTMFLIQVGLMLLLELIRPKQDNNQKPSPLGDFSIPTAQEDRPVPVIFGTVRQNGPNVIWYGDYKAVPHTKRVRTGMISKEDVVVGHKYHLGLQMALGRGEIDKITGLWVDDVQLFPGDHVDAVSDIWKAEYDRVDQIAGYFHSYGRNGKDYQVGDVLTPANASPWHVAPQVQVTSVNVLGGITGFSLIEDGQILPENTSSVNDSLGTAWFASLSGAQFRSHHCSFSGGSGTGARFAMSFEIDDSGKPAGTTHLRGRVWGNEDAAATEISADGGSLNVKCYNLFGGDGDHGQGGVAGFVQFKNGSNTQTAPDYMDKAQVNGVTMQYRGTAYACPVAEPLYLGMTTSIKNWAFEVQRIPDPLSLGTDATINGVDANPMNVLYEALTNEEWGLGISASLIDSANFAAAGQTLAAENHGYSQLWDREMSVDEFIKGIEEQVDGVLYQDTDGKFKIVLARGDYTLSAQPEITNSNRRSLEEFSRGTWAETTNMVYVNYADRSDNWRSTYSIAQDQGNIKIQNGQPLPTTTKYSGVTNAALANDLAWRDLRTLSFPLAKATVTLDRTFWDLKPGQVIRFTDTNLGLSEMAMRVRSVNLGSLTENTVRVTLVQDVFYAAAGSFDPRENSEWENPVGNLPALSETRVIEAPRAVENKASAAFGENPVSGRIYANAVAGANMDEFDLYVGTALAAEGVQLKSLGRLSDALGHDGADSGTLTLIPVLNDGNEATEIAAQFVDAASNSDLSNLDNLVLIDDELLLVSGAQLSGDINVELTGIYRGVLDTVPTPHSPGTPVYQVAASGGLSLSGYPVQTGMQVRLVPSGRTGSGDYDNATAVSVDIEDRYNSPYPPSQLSLNGTAWGSAVTITANGGSADAYYFTLDLLRRDFRATDHIAPLSQDAAALDASYPAANSTVHYWSLVQEDGTVLTGPHSMAGSSVQITRNELLADGVDHEDDVLYMRVTAEHTVDGSTYQSVQSTLNPFTMTWGLEGQQNLGILSSGTISAVYTVDSAGAHSAALVTSLSGDVEYRVNGGAWTTLITSGNTSGSTSSLSVSDTLEIRHLDASLSTNRFLAITAPSGGTDAYALLT